MQLSVSTAGDNVGLGVSPFCHLQNPDCVTALTALTTAARQQIEQKRIEQKAASELDEQQCYARLAADQPARESTRAETQPSSFLVQSSLMASCIAFGAIVATVVLCRTRNVSG